MVEDQLFLRGVFDEDIIVKTPNFLCLLLHEYQVGMEGRSVHLRSFMNSAPVPLPQPSYVLYLPKPTIFQISSFRAAFLTVTGPALLPYATNSDEGRLKLVV